MSESADRPSVSEAYNVWARTYDVDVNPTRELAALALRHADLSLADARVLEIGCGTGRNTRWLAERSAGVIGLDFSAEMLARAAAFAALPNVQLVRHDIRDPWPLAQSSVDIVIAMLVLEHVERLQSIYIEAARVLRKGGQMLLCELHPMRQMLGKQAEFRPVEGGRVERIAAHLHDVSEYVNGSLEAGFAVTCLKEWRDDGSAPMTPPRILSLQLARSARE